MTYTEIKFSLYRFLDSLIGKPFDMTLEPYSSEYTDVTDENVSVSHVIYDTTHMSVV